jgi:hypothetical protein
MPWPGIRLAQGRSHCAAENAEQSLDRVQPNASGPGAGFEIAGAPRTVQSASDVQPAFGPQHLDRPFKCRLIASSIVVETMFGVALGTNQGPRFADHHRPGL